MHSHSPRLGCVNGGTFSGKSLDHFCRNTLPSATKDSYTHLVSLWFNLFCLPLVTDDPHWKFGFRFSSVRFLYNELVGTALINHITLTLRALASKEYMWKVALRHKWAGYGTVVHASVGIELINTVFTVITLMTLSYYSSENIKGPLRARNTSSSFRRWTRGVNRKVSTSTANGGCHDCQHSHSSRHWNHQQQCVTLHNYYTYHRQRDSTTT